MTKQDGNIKMRALAYNSDTTEVQLTGDEETDKRTIQGFRASGSTSFVSTFNRLGEIFSDEKQDPSKTYFVFFMTDGNDTCSNARQIMAEKEKLQTQIEKFGAQVIFHAIGFSGDHDEAFLESLTYIGTSDGSYSFVSPQKGTEHWRKSSWPWSRPHHPLSANAATSRSPARTWTSLATTSWRRPTTSFCQPP